MSQEDGLFYELERTGQMRRLVSEEEVRHAIFHPPETTRAFFRGRAVARFGPEISSLQWDEISFRDGAATRTVHLPEPVHSAELERMNELIRSAPTFAEFLGGLRASEV